MKDNNLDDLMAEIIKRLGVKLSPVVQDKKLIFPAGLKYRYWHIKNKKKRYLFCYSSTKNANGKYTSWIYWPTKEGFELRRLIEQKTKKKAIERAYRLYQKWEVSKQKKV